MRPNTSDLAPLVALLCLACQGDALPFPDEKPQRSPRGSGGSAADTEEVPGWDGEHEDPADWVFSLDRVHQVEILLSANADTNLRQDPYTYVEASLSLDGQTLDPVGLRLKGKIGSFRDLDAKAGFKVDFNRFDAQLTLSGLERLNLDNMVQDPSCNHDRIAYRIYNAVGVPAPRVGYAQVRVNGDSFGVYALVEDYDDVLLDWAYSDPSGNLYDGDYIPIGDGGYRLADFQRTMHDNFQLDEGQDVGHEDIYQITEALLDSCEGEGFMDAVGAVVRLEDFAQFWAAEIWLGQWDGYAANTNNYRVYFDPADGGRARLHPWDHDNAFLTGDWVVHPSGELALCCKRDEACHALFHEALKRVDHAAGAMGLVGDLRDTMELLEPYLRDDPRRECSMESVEDEQGALALWLQVRGYVLANFPTL